MNSALTKAEQHLPTAVHVLTEKLDRALAEFSAVRRKLGARISRSQQAKRAAWRLRIRFLAALYKNAGNISKAAQAAGIRRQRAYDHRIACQLFADCWEYIRTYVSIHGCEAGWEEIWPARLALPEVENIAGVSGLPSRLVEAGVVDPAAWLTPTERPANDA